MTRSVQLQTRICREVSSALPAGFLRSLHRRSALSSLFTLGHIWLAIAIAFWLGAAALTLPLILAVPCALAVAVFMATRINALNVQVHEGSHGSLAENATLNEWLTNGLAGYWIGLDAAGYRTVHGSHHQFLNEAQDPDRPLYVLAPDRAALRRAFASDLLGISLLRRAAVYARQAAERGDAAPGTGRSLHSLGHLAGKGLSQLALLGSQVWLHGVGGGVLVYGLFWLVPLVSLYPATIRLRIVAEHFASELMDTDRDRVIFVARTSVCGWLEHYLFGAQMDYHFEHHLFPGIPYANLRRLHQALLHERFFETSSNVVVAHSLSGGYFHFWRALLRSDYLAGAVGAPVVGAR